MNTPNTGEFCSCQHRHGWHTWSTIENGNVVTRPSKCRIWGCRCASFVPGEEPAVLEEIVHAELLAQMRREYVPDSAAKYIADLDKRVRRLEGKKE